MNDTMRFEGATTATYNSILRRSLVAELKAKFVSADQLKAEYPRGDHEAAGVLQH